MYDARLRENLPRVREALEAAARRVGRSAGDVTLVAVTKGHPVEAVRAALEAGLRDLGENRVEELEEKVAAVGRGAAVWHLVGHLQSRKARRALGVTDLLHSLDRPKLARKLSRLAVEAGIVVPVLVQVNVSGEGSKSGYPLADARRGVEEILGLPGLEVRGLMTMAPLTPDEAVLRGTFRRLRELHEELSRLPDYTGRELSMGMTNDFEIAVEEGSTMVRLGTALFGERPE